MESNRSAGRQPQHSCRYVAESLRSKGRHHRYIADCYTVPIMTIQMIPVRSSSYPRSLSE